MERIKEFLTQGIGSCTLETIGAEIETQFVDMDDSPISVATSQQILNHLISGGWEAVSENNGLITGLSDKSNNRIFYELGRHNIEIATAESVSGKVVAVARGCLDQLYRAADLVGAHPYFGSILNGEEDLLVIPDERDAIWLELDGRSALAPLARTSSVQFTFSVSLQDVVFILNKLGQQITLFMDDFPQDRVWKRYIEESRANYRSDRYGGPLHFESLDEYCRLLTLNDVVRNSTLVPFLDIQNLDIPLFIRSVWWHFRLKRYGSSLCIEVRPMARKDDESLRQQLEMVLDIVS